MTEEHIKNGVEISNIVVDNNAMMFEKVNTIQTSVQYLTKDIKRGKLLSITSSNKGEGKTFFTTNYGYVCAQNSLRTLLIDLDFYHPSLSKQATVEKKVGFSEIIENELSWERGIYETNEPLLQVMPAGMLMVNPKEILNSVRCERLFQQLKSQYDVILLDCPPVRLFSDARIISSKADGTILVVSPNTSQQEVAQGVDLLKTLDVNIIGSVLNDKKYSKKQINSYNYY